MFKSEASRNLLKVLKRLGREDRDRVRLAYQVSKRNTEFCLRLNKQKLQQQK
jgi:RNA binding exosome subunit